MKNRNDKTFMDNVLVLLQKDRGSKVEKVFYKPDRARCIKGFCFSVIFFIIMLGFCIVKFSIGFVLLFGLSIGLLFFYGVNLFTKEGLMVQKYVDKRIIEQLESENEIDNLNKESEVEQEDN